MKSTFTQKFFLSLVTLRLASMNASFWYSRTGPPVLLYLFKKRRPSKKTAWTTSLAKYDCFFYFDFRIK